MIEKHFTVVDQAGIHARPASILVSTANKFESDIFLVFEGKNTNLKSILGVMSLGIGTGEKISIRSEGPDEEKALDELEKVLRREDLAI
ncbi:phosphocarrier protein HPr [Pallidibacillus thermolactis]|jgi:phosphocarrier protein HPr|uniref:phosphocarrier protein HPr n=1 Tax=Pallidibacillus thermolactis TaxID=251051 RepID=UPI002E1C37F4|nr:phosphocarrier protein HPr [Pallidibacillus thermolactis subsp. kokeshiiformis]